MRIDCSVGGGQIARTAIALSCRFARPVILEGVRKTRPKPGLAAQHLAGIAALAQLFEAKTAGLTLGSQSIRFAPHLTVPKMDVARIDIPTAGSIGLILQAVLLGCAYKLEKPLRIIVHGGSTASKWSPSVAYIENVMLPLSGLDADFSVERHGYYPKGGAQFSVTLGPKGTKPKPLRLASHHLQKKCGLAFFAHASEELAGARVLERIKHAFKNALVPLGDRFHFETSTLDYSPTYSTGCHAVIHSLDCKLPFGFDVLGARGVSSETIGRKLFAKLEEFEKFSCSLPVLDEHASDQIIPYLALDGGEAVIRLTEHARAGIQLVNQFLPQDFKVECKEESRDAVVVEGRIARVTATGVSRLHT